MKILSHQEIRDVQKCVRNIRYPTDIFTKLPLELSQRIAQYLGLSNATRARAVSKDWLSILASRQTIQCLLQPWHGTDCSTLRIPDGLSERAVSSLKAEYVSAYRSGAAFDKLTVQRPISRHGAMSDSVAYSSGRVAWIDKNTTTTHVLSLEDNGICLTDQGDGRELGHLALSNSMMAVTTLSGECRITEIRSGTEHRFQLVPKDLEKIAVAKDSVAILHRPSPSNPMKTGVTIWTVNSCTPLHFSVSLLRSRDQALRPRDLKIMLDLSGKSVVVFERVAEAKFVHFTRFSLEGEVQAEGTLELPITESYAKYSEESTPTDNNGWATVWSYSTVRLEASKNFDGTDRTIEVLCVLRVQYKLDCNVLRLKKDSVEIPANYAFANDLGDDLGDDLAISNMFFWNDIAYCQARYWDFTALNVIDFSKSFMAFAVMGNKMKFVLTKREWERFQNRGGMLQSLFLGDERFLINACQHGFFVFAFDKNHGMTDTDAGFKEERKEAKETRDGPWSCVWSGRD